MKGIHNVFYIVIIAICISGFITMKLSGFGDALSQNSYHLISKENSGTLKAHSLLTVIMIILLFLHIGGIIKHFILTKENILKRII